MKKIIKINVNDKGFDVPENVTVQALVGLLKLDIKSTAVAVNKEIVPKSRYAYFRLKEDDKVDLVGIAPGG